VNRPRIWVSTIAITWLLVGSTSRAEWTMPNLNPFSKPASTSRTEKKTSLLKMPKWKVFGSSETRRSQPKPPSTWDKMTDGTKEFLGKTKDVLTPWDDPPSRNAGRRSDKPKESGTAAFFTGWFKEEEPQRPRTVSEWLSQPRP
jgi:hypothetical protein